MKGMNLQEQKKCGILMTVIGPCCRCWITATPQLSLDREARRLRRRAGPAARGDGHLPLAAVALMPDVTPNPCAHAQRHH